MNTTAELTLLGYSEALSSWLESDQELLELRGAEEPETTEASFSAGAAMMARLAAGGWNRHGWPVAAGGLGGDARFRGVLYDQLAAHGHRLPDQMVPVETLGPALIRFAPELAARWFPAVLNGTEAWCQGFSEPNSGSDLASLACRATHRRIDGQDVLVIDGQKTWTTLGHLSQRMAVLCRTGTPDSRHRGLSLVMVDLDAPGVTVRPIVFANGLNELSEVFFDQTAVGLERLVGAEHQGWEVAMYLLQFERGMYAWQRQAWLLSALRQLGEELPRAWRNSERRLGEAYAAVLALRARTGITVQRLAAGEAVGPEASADKVLLAGAEQMVLDLARDLLPDVFLTGSGARSSGWRAAWWYTRAASIYGGSAEIQRSIIADRVLQLPREGR